MSTLGIFLLLSLAPLSSAVVIKPKLRYSEATQEIPQTPPAEPTPTPAPTPTTPTPREITTPNAPQPKKQNQKITQNEKIEIPDPADTIPLSIRALPTPPLLASSSPLLAPLPPLSKNPQAQRYLQQGTFALVAGWDTAAAQNFSAAIQLDPTSLFAHWGLSMSLITPTPETQPAAAATLSRLLSLIENHENTSAYERDLSYGLIALIRQGPNAAKNVYLSLSQKFPDDLLVSTLAALFQRNGYDALGTPNDGQLKAEASLRQLIDKNPQEPLPIVAYLTIHADAPKLDSELPRATELQKIAPTYPPFNYLLGHYQWRTGHLRDAANSFQSSAQLYQTWMTQNNTTFLDCPNYLLSQKYLATTLVSLGKFPEAFALAKKTSSLNIPTQRSTSLGAQTMLWEIHPLPALILLAENPLQNARQANDSLPSAKTLLPLRPSTLSFWFLDALRLHFASLQALNQHNLKEAEQLSSLLDQHCAEIIASQQTAQAIGQDAYWNRAITTLRILTNQLRAELSLAGPTSTRPAALTWFRAAADLDHPSTQLLPPILLTPAHNKVAQYYLLTKQPQKAIDAYQQTLSLYPNNFSALTQLKALYTSLNQPENIQKIEQKLSNL